MADFSRLIAVFLLIVQSVFLRDVFGVRLSPCGEDNTAEVEEEKTDNTFRCSGLGSGLQVDWTLLYQSVEQSAGFCVDGGGECQLGSFGSAFTPSRVSDTESQLVVNPNGTNSKEYYQTWTLRCKDSSGSADICQMDYIVPAQGSCLVQTGTGLSRFNLSGSCSLQPGARSSRGRFKCRWTREDLASWKVTVDLTEDTYQTGCTLDDRPLPVATGQYTYNVTLIPGRNSVSAGTIDIARPAGPTVTDCGGNDFIPESTTVSCTCTTDTIGQPSGRLQWVKVGDSSINKVGNYGDKIFTVSQTLQRGDHQSSEFRCNVEWTEIIPGAAIKFNVGYPPTQVVLEVNQAETDLTVDEHQSVAFRCGNSNGLPDPTLSLVKKDNSSVLLSKTSSSLNHEVVGRCEDSGQYVCKADNAMGPEFSGTPMSLFVRCFPRGNYDVGDVNFDDEPVSTTFDVTAYPVPDLITFDYLGPTLNDTETSEVNDTLIQLTGECRTKSGVVHQSTCTVTVTLITSHTAAGFYRVNISNSEGSGQFRLQVLYKAPVTGAPNNGDNGETDIGPVVGGVVAAVVVLAVIVFVIVLVMKKRKDPAKEKLDTSRGRNAANGGHAAGVLEGLDNPAHDHDHDHDHDPPPPESASHIEAHSSMDIEAYSSVREVYAVVNKPKKPAQAPAEVGAEAEAASEPAFALYVEVDKTKKKKKAAAPPKPEAKAKKGPQAKPRKKDKKGGQGHIYGNVEEIQGKGKKGKNPPALPLEEKTADTGRQVNPDGLVYTSVDFLGVAFSSDIPAKPLTDDQGVLYSGVDFAKTANLQE